jgi:3-dehydroquinate dehydratase type I
MVLSVKNLVIGKKPVLICTILEAEQEKILNEMEKSVEAGADLIELRIDKLKNNEEVKAVLPKITALPKIVSCRGKDALGYFEGTEEERVERLMVALESGADIIDTELTMCDDLRTMIMKKAQKKKIPVLMGYESLQETPDRETLIEKAKMIRDLKPDIAKIAVRAVNYTDLITVLKLTLQCKELFDIPFTVIAIGRYGSPSRPLGCVLGSSMTYCTTKKRAEAPPGQLSVEDTRMIIDILS